MVEYLVKQGERRVMQVEGKADEMGWRVYETCKDHERCLPATFPYGCNGEWGKIYTRNQGAMSGALFIVFNINGDPSKAQGYFKNINGQVADTFDITVQASEAKRQARRP